MNFKKVFRGYDPDEVNKYITETAAKEAEIRVSQKERIDELSDENYTLREQLKRYQADEQAISKSLIASQNLAQELKFDAKKYSDLVLSRAKIFYATWRAYSQTLVSSLTDDEVRQFNALQKKIEGVINAYEGKDVAMEVYEAEKLDSKRQGVAAAAARQETTAAKPAKATYANPITKVENAADQAIDLRELTETQQTLEELCAELGLGAKKNNKR